VTAEFYAFVENWQMIKKLMPARVQPILYTGRMPHLRDKFLFDHLHVRNPPIFIQDGVPSCPI
jgi:hypothetical protein